jgi:GTP-binding protein YchF
MELAIVGLARSGKTTVFNALTHAHAPTGTYAGEAELHVGAVKMPDERLDKLGTLFRPKKVTHVDIQFVDIPGGLTWRGAGRGEGPAPPVQAALDRADALVHVVRGFQNDAVPPPEGSVDPARDIDAFNLELVFADLTIVERRLERLDIAVRSARAGEREAGEKEVALLRRVKEGFEQEKPLYAQGLSTEEIRSLGNYNLLSAKPLLTLLNIGEEDVSRQDEIEAEYRGQVGPQTEVAALCGKLEMELNDLSEEEAAEFRADLGAGEPAADRISRLAFELLGLVSFFTVGEDECRAWAIPKNTPAVKAAGRVHSDMEKGFIRGEVIRWDELLATGSLAEARKRGVLRGEGKTYVVQDGDVFHILFNV